MEIKIRVAKPSDAKQIVNVSKVGWLSTYVNSDYAITKQDILARDFRSRIKKWGDSIRNEKTISHFWVATFKEKVIGYSSALKGQRFNEITIYILPQFQSRGIGTKLIRKAFKWLGSRKKIKIDVVSYNTKAINFYKKEGFIKKGKGKKPLPTGKALPLTRMIKNKF